VKKHKLITSLLWASFALFVITVGLIFAPEFLPIYPFSVALLLLASLGFAIIALTLKSQFERKPKAFLLLAGSSLAGIPVFAVLHNLVYALFILIFGEGFWNGGDEPFFFILALLVCPISYLVGFVSSLVCLRKR
jgi:hypothetical protein